MRLPELPAWTPSVTVMFTILVLASPKYGGLALGAVVCMALLLLLAALIVRFVRWLGSTDHY